MWARNEEVVNSINEQNENTKYLPGLKLPERQKATTDLEEAVKDARIIIIAIPSQFLGSVIKEYSNVFPVGVPLVSAAKGIEKGSLRLVSEILEEELPGKFHPNLSYLSGPSFAKEIIQKMPTVVSIASKNEPVAQQVQEAFHTNYFRSYRTADVVGVEVGGALKNVIAIAAGVSDGLNLGHNTRAAIITRGLAEITRLGVAKGAEAITFLGLAGMGDLVLTCTGDLSRNRTVGKKLGEGMTLQEIISHMNQVAEGIDTTASAHQLSNKLGVEMAITSAVHRLLYEDETPERIWKDLMGRELKREVIQMQPERRRKG